VHGSVVAAGAGRAGSARQPTLETVAALAGVSRATVSRVINDDPRVSAQARQAVEAAIERIGYVPNRAARTLVTRRTGSIALVVREPVEFGFADPYLSSVVIAASQSLVGTGIQLAVMMAQDDADHAELARYVRGGHVDGVILVSVHDDDPLPGQLIRAGVPVVIGGRPPTALDGVAYVDVDNVEGGAIVARHLLRTGRARLAIIAGPADMTASTDRLAGYREVLREAGMPPPAVAYGMFDRPSGEAAMRELLRREPDLDAVFAGNDLMAIGAMRVLRERGRSVPGDVAVVGFDDVELCQHTDPPLSSVHQAIAQQARTMVELLLAMVDGQAVHGAHILPLHLVVRGSSAAG
jgi:DNA-binding LacI/PurR family transcriptional regulator